MDDWTDATDRRGATTNAAAARDGHIITHQHSIMPYKSLAYSNRLNLLQRINSSRPSSEQSFQHNLSDTNFT